MSEAPKTRNDLACLLGDIYDAPGAGQQILDVLEGYGLRIVPAEPTKPMWEAMAEHDSGGMSAMYRAAIAANPFAPENPNG